jgi:multidrug efflux pump subunit AcrA (membrane-fusion protein)
MDESLAQRAARLRRAWNGPAFSRLRTIAGNRIVLFALGPAIIAVGALVYFALNAGTISTDDATVAAARVAISPEVRGRIIEVSVHDNQVVQAGTSSFVSMRRITSVLLKKLARSWPPRD